MASNNPRNGGRRTQRYTGGYSNNGRSNAHNTTNQPSRPSAYRSGITSYERSRSLRDRKSDPYRRSNMIYARKQQPRWPIIIAIAAVLVVVVALGTFACNRCSANNEQQQENAAVEASTQASAESSTEESSVQQETSTAASTEKTSKNLEYTEVDTSVAGVDPTDARLVKSGSKNNKKPGKKVCYLTFDDGPSANTEEIMDILERHNAKATWFVIGKCTHPEKMVDLWEAGHQIALHSYSHEYDSVYASVSGFFNEMDKEADEVEKYLGFRPTLLRFPGGSHNSYNTTIYQELEDGCAERGLHYFDWNVSSGDASGNGVPAKTILKNIKKESKYCNSCCVLMHDTENKATTVEALEDIIEYYESEGFEFDVLTATSFGYHF